jgi:hypothetical protein
LPVPPRLTLRVLAAVPRARPARLVAAPLPVDVDAVVAVVAAADVVDVL